MDDCSYRMEFEDILLKKIMKSKNEVTNNKNNKYNNDDKIIKIKNIK